MPELETFLETSHPDAVIGTESWLTDDVGRANIFPSQHTEGTEGTEGKKEGGYSL